ncbi:MAG: shikimate kinase [Patescibacteria group bacterium]|nr:shikimate kinase [Patescibacteria group bacterium]MEA3497312.1 shikimate kinase [Bacteroidota bacterium]
MTYKQKVEIKGSKTYKGGALGFSGPPGIGKSTIGKIIASKLSIPFYDLDDLIAKKANVKTTKEIINNEGLPKFKQIQHLCFQEVFQKDNQEYVLSFGGHTTYEGCDPKLINENKALVNDHLFNICLIPSDDITEVVDILWPRQNDGKRETGSSNADQYRQYIQNLIPQYIQSADKVVFIHASSVDDTVLAIMNDIIRTKK